MWTRHKMDREALADALGRSRVAGTSDAPGFSAGYMLKLPRSKTNIGLNYRSPVTHHLKGRASFAFGNDYALKRFLDEWDELLEGVCD